MDLRKEIKLSDLLPKRGKKSSPEQVVTTEEKEDKARRHSGGGPARGESGARSEEEYG